MKISIIGTAFPLRGGIAHYIALLFNALSIHHDVEIITFKRQYPKLLFPGKSQVEVGEAEAFRVPSTAIIDSLNPITWLKAGRMIQHRAPDILLFKYWLPFFGPCFGTIARVAKRHTKTKVVYICDNVVPHEHRMGDRLLTSFAFNAGDGFVVQSRSVERDLLTLRPNARFAYVPHPLYNGFGSAVPVTEARAYLGISAPNVLLFFGYIRRYKGLSILLDALAHVANRLDVHLLIVGEFYEDESQYRAQIARLGLSGRVTVHSAYVPNEEVKYFFSAADAVILPYTSATQSGIAQIAFNFDIPVIATDVGGLAEIIRDGETGLLVPPANSTALAEQITEYFTAVDRSRMKMNVREEKKKYAWENLVGAIEKLGS